MAKQAGRFESHGGLCGCAVLRPPKVAARVLRVVRPAQNVPPGSFETQ